MKRLFEKYGYNGMPEHLLKDVCRQSHVNKGASTKQYGITEMYSQGRILREYSGFPVWLPLNVCADHGAGGLEILKSEFENTAYAMFAFSDEKCRNYRAVTSKPCFRVLHPFVWYRHAKGIEQDKDAQGTLAFPAHSLSDVDCEFDVEEYIDKLEALPDDMKPVCVNIFTNDILKGLHVPFMNRGMPVYSAGNISDIRFVDRFYDILRHFKYSVSNTPGSYMFYSVEMGIPFSLYGNRVKFINQGNDDFPLGESFYGKVYYEEMGYKLFSQLSRRLTEDQEEYVRDYFYGDMAVLTPQEMRSILYSAWKMRPHPCLDAIAGIRRLLKQKIKDVVCGRKDLWEI